MGRTTPRSSDEGLESTLDLVQSQGPSREDVETALVRLRAFRAELVQEQKAMGKHEDVLSVAYKMVLDRLWDSFDACANLRGSMPQNYTELVAAQLRTLGEVTVRSSRELSRYMQTEALDSRQYSQLQLDLNARLLLEINEFI